MTSPVSISKITAYISNIKVTFSLSAFIMEAIQKDGVCLIVWIVQPVQGSFILDLEALSVSYS